MSESATWKHAKELLQTTTAPFWWSLITGHSSQHGEKDSLQK